VVSTAEIIGKIKAAADARVNPNFKIMIRTDARTVLGLDEAIDRARQGFEAGADLAFVEAPQSVEELQFIAQKLKGIPLMANMVERGKTPLFSNSDLEAMGYKMVVYPLTALYASAAAMLKVMRELKDKGSTQGLLGDIVTFEEFNQLVGLQELIGLENKYAR
ncbi:MAG: isocitrate lyase/phosphoenolpyruvate mutase family protein, partial [Bacillota bacterium]|nr:isocitrate lyase/phosphoenolpyruvate mutase family protein [Bacillota bacterium]